MSLMLGTPDARNTPPASLLGLAWAECVGHAFFLGGMSDHSEIQPLSTLKLMSNLNVALSCVTNYLMVRLQELNTDLVEVVLFY